MLQLQSRIPLQTSFISPWESPVSESEAALSQGTVLSEKQEYTGWAPESIAVLWYREWRYQWPFPSRALPGAVRNGRDMGCSVQTVTTAPLYCLSKLAVYYLIPINQGPVAINSNNFTDVVLVLGALGPLLWLSSTLQNRQARKGLLGPAAWSSDPGYSLWYVSLMPCLVWIWIMPATGLQLLPLGAGNKFSSWFQYFFFQFLIYSIIVGTAWAGSPFRVCPLILWLAFFEIYPSGGAFYLCFSHPLAKLCLLWIRWWHEHFHLILLLHVCKFSSFLSQPFPLHTIDKSMQEKKNVRRKRKCGLGEPLAKDAWANGWS